MLLPGGELGSVRGHAQWQDTPLGRCMQGCQQLCGEAPQGARLSGESSGSAADPEACSARDEKPFVQRPPSYGPRGLQAASRADRLTPSRASLACRGRKTPTPLQLTVSRAKTRCSTRGARMWSGEILMRLRTRRSSLRTASPGSGMVFAAFPGIDEGAVSEHTAPRTYSIYQ
ncbi:hypothetical protein TcYC6_0059770 [Trypanosoma cruzi]|nr:hypothetical protein TcYC6_0059770 [Trypanosoma cruzi]